MSLDPVAAKAAAFQAVWHTATTLADAVANGQEFSWEVSAGETDGGKALDGSCRIVIDVAAPGKKLLASESAGAAE